MLETTSALTSVHSRVHSLEGFLTGLPESNLDLGKHKDRFLRLLYGPYLRSMRTELHCAFTLDGFKLEEEDLGMRKALPTPRLDGHHKSGLARNEGFYPESLDEKIHRERDTKLDFGKHNGKLLGVLVIEPPSGGNFEWALKDLQTRNTCQTHTLDGHEQIGLARNYPGSLNEKILRQLGPETDAATYASLLKHYTSVKALSEGERVHEHMNRNGHADNRFLSNLLVEMYGKCGSLNYARAVFDKIVYPNLYSWSIIIAAYAQNGLGKEAIQLFEEMQTQVEPNKVTFTCILDACAGVAALEKGREIHALIVGNRWESDVVVGTALVNMYGKCSSLDDSRAVFAGMPLRNAVSWNAMIAVCSQNGHGKDALQLFDAMQAKGIQPNKVTFICILNACATVDVVEEGQEIHAIIIRNRWESDAMVGTSLINMYSKCGSLDDSRVVFAKMPLRDVVSWNAMITACVQEGHNEEALQLFGQMQAESIDHNKITFICILDACASETALEEGRHLHATVVGSKWELDVVVGTALVNMYGKCGNLDDSRSLFSEMRVRNVVSWNTIISASAQNGFSKEALQLFCQMKAEGVKPDEVTFVCVLTACSHTGLVADAMQYFVSMNRHHGMNPSAEHYGCIVDLLGRQGLLKDAEDLILNMPIKNARSAWLSLLSSCKIHGDVERGLRVANGAFASDPMIASPYVLLANIYAKLDDIEKV